MERIVIQVQDKEKARILFELLTALDFVNSVETSEKEDTEISLTSDGLSDFFSLAGLWEGREISLESLRQNAWPKQLP